MSQVNVLVIKNKKFHQSQCSYRFFLNLINKDFKFLNKFLEQKAPYPMDSGYFLIDFDDKIILSNQTAFSSTHISQEIRSKLKKEFEYYEIF